MLIIGTTGPIGHGKSSFAKTLMALVPNSIRLESGQLISDIANALHDSTREIPNRDDIESINKWLRPLPALLLDKVKIKVSFDDIALKNDDILIHPANYEKLFLHIDALNNDPSILKTHITTDNKEQYRPILQWLGGYLTQKVDPGIWYKEIIRKVFKAESSSHDLCIISGLRFPNDAVMVRSAGGLVIKIYRPDHLQFDRSDPTERERDTINPDSTICSNGTLDDLKNCAKKILKDINDNKLKSTYYTK